MPNCFQLTTIGSNEAAMLHDVDAALCAHFGKPVHEKHWFAGWYQSIGFSLALGQTFAEIREDFERDAQEDPEPQWYRTQIAIVDYLESHYTSDAWVESSWGGPNGE